MKALRFLSFLLASCIFLTSFASCAKAHDAENDSEDIMNKITSVITDSTEDLEGISISIDNIEHRTDEIREIVESIDLGEDVDIESVQVRYLSPEYISELEYNSISNFLWEVSALNYDDLQDEAYFISVEDGEVAPIIMNRAELIAYHEATNAPAETNKNNAMRDFLIGAGIILLEITLSIAGTPAVSCIAMTAMRSAMTYAVLGSAVYATAAAITYRVSEGTFKGASEIVVPAASQGFRDGVILGSISGLLKGPELCFPADTKVVTEAGMVSIQNIRIGDTVVAYNETIGKNGFYKVVNTFENTASELIKFTFTNGESIEATPTHPFYDYNSKRWIEAKYLNPNDVLVDVNGEPVVLQLVEHRILEEPLTVYNLNVDSAHTFYISSGENSVLAHNSCAHQTSAWRAERAKYYKSQAELYKNSINANALSASGKYRLTESNISRMAAGRAPIAVDGRSLQLHHTSGISNNLYAYSEVTATEHWLNYKALHPWLFK